MLIDRQRAYVFISKWEAASGPIDHMYLDTHRDRSGAPAGLVTIGIGSMIPTAAAACNLRFVRAGTSTPAKMIEIAAEWDRVKTAPFGLVASAYRKWTGLVLPPSELRALFDARVDEFERQLCNLFGGFDGFPPSAKLGLLDMAFNVGIGGMADFKFMGASVRAGNWTHAAGQCHRAGDDGTPEHPTLHGYRNQATRALFLAAARGE